MQCEISGNSPKLQNADRIAGESHLPLFSPTPLFCTGRGRKKRRFFEFHCSRSDFISQTIAAHSDRNVSPRAPPCPVQLGARSLAPAPRPAWPVFLAACLAPPVPRSPPSAWSTSWKHRGPGGGMPVSAVNLHWAPERDPACSGLFRA